MWSGPAETLRRTQDGLYTAAVDVSRLISLSFQRMRGLMPSVLCYEGLRQTWRSVATSILHWLWRGHNRALFDLAQVRSSRAIPASGPQSV